MRPELSTRIPRVHTPQRLRIHNPDPARFLLSAHRPHRRRCPHSRPQPATPGAPAHCPAARTHWAPAHSSQAQATPGSRCNARAPGTPRTPARNPGRPLRRAQIARSAPHPSAPPRRERDRYRDQDWDQNRAHLSGRSAALPAAPRLRRLRPARCRWGRCRVRPGPPAVPRVPPPGPPGATGPPCPCRVHLARKEPSQGEGLEKPWLCPPLLHAAVAEPQSAGLEESGTHHSTPERTPVLSPLQGQNMSSALL